MTCPRRQGGTSAADISAEGRRTPPRDGKEDRCILVLAAGKVVESGTHHQLLAHGGLYREYHRKQFASALREPQEQTARPVLVVWVVFDYLTLAKYCLFHFANADVSDNSLVNRVL